MDHNERQNEARVLLTKIQQALPRLDAVWQQITHPFVGEDLVFRYYSQSFKVFHLQQYPQLIADVLQDLAPDRPLCRWFMEIVAEGTGKEFTPEMNQRWTETTRPIVEAFFHARYFLEMARKYGRELSEPPTPLRPCGWAALLELYGLR